MSDSSVEAANTGFLGRWSRLKARSETVQAEFDAHSPAVARVDTGQTVIGINQPAVDLPAMGLHELAEGAGSGALGVYEAGVDEAGVDEAGVDEASVEREALCDADMPDIESLDEGSDFSGFLSEKVSEQLRRKALSKLFHLPEFNIRDGLNEYDEDYSTFVPLGDTVTYQMKQFIERQKQQFEDALNEDARSDEAADPDLAQVQDPVAEVEEALPQTMAKTTPETPLVNPKPVAVNGGDAKAPSSAT